MDDRLPEVEVFSSADLNDREPFITRRRDWHMDWGIFIEVVGRVILGMFGGG